MKENLICTNCPLGCTLEVSYNHKEVLRVIGNSCKKGLKYAEKEVFNPERIVTTTVRIKGADCNLIPVKTDKAVPKDTTFKVIKQATGIYVQAPIKCGDIIIENILNTGANLVATRSLGRINK